MAAEGSEFAEIIDPGRSRRLRREVLRPESEPSDPLPGDDLLEAVHFGVFDGFGAVVSTCFAFPDVCPWLPDITPAWHLRQMATDPAHRGQGFAGLVVDAVVDYVRVRGAAVLWCHARQLAVPMYRRHGFIDVGELFTDEEHTVPHLQMHQLLS